MGIGKIYISPHAIKAKYRLRFIFACFIIFSLYSLGSWYTDTLKRSMIEACTESISELTESLSELQAISKAFGQAEKMTLERLKK